jgi:hypothetical protein
MSLPRVVQELQIGGTGGKPADLGPLPG